MDTNKTGKFLQDLRKENNITQEELGEQLGVTNKTISRWETGTYIPPVDILLRLSAIYNVTVNELLSGERLTTADYQKKAEENIVTTLNNTSVVKKRSQKTLIICLSVLIPLIILCFFLLTTLGILFGINGIREYTSGDFIYKKYDSNKSGMYAEIIGLSTQGSLKEVIVIPETIDGLPVVAVRDRSIFGAAGSMNKFTSKYLKKLYFTNANIILGSNQAFDNCKNLSKVFVVNLMGEEVFNKFVFTNLKSDVFICKDAYEIMSPNWYQKEHKFAANVTYYYNYFGTPNGDCYWLDQVEAGDKIEFIPPEPIRSSNRYKFDGWYTEKEYINKWDFASNVMPSTGELNLYAKWVENKN